MRSEIQIVVDIADDQSQAHVEIKVRGLLNFACLMVATEHMINMTALESEDGYDNTITRLVEGASKARRVQ
jgi:hypothetical protein